MRTGRVKAPVVYQPDQKFEIGKAVEVIEGNDVTIIANGLLVAEAIRAAEALDSEGISARVLDFHTVKPLDREAIAARRFGNRRHRGRRRAPGGWRAGRARGPGGGRDAPLRHGIRRPHRIRRIWLSGGVAEEVRHDGAQHRGCRAESPGEEISRCPRPILPDGWSMQLLEQSPACHWVFDADGRFIYACGNTTPLFGRPAADLPGRRISDLVRRGGRRRTGLPGFRRTSAGETLMLRERYLRTLVQPDVSIRCARPTPRPCTPPVTRQDITAWARPRRNCARPPAHAEGAGIGARPVGSLPARRSGAQPQRRRPAPRPAAHGFRIASARDRARAPRNCSKCSRPSWPVCATSATS